MAVLDLTPTEVALLLYRGDDLVVPVPFVNKDESPRDMSGHVFEAKIAAVNSDTSLVTLTVDDSQAAIGDINFTATAAQLDQLATGERYRWDVQGTSSGITRTYFGGEVTMSEDV